MNQAQFEKLSRNLMNVIRRVKDEESLLKVSCGLLGAEVAFLVCRESADEGAKGTLRYVYPHEYQEAVKDNLNDLLEWYNFVVPTPGFEGFIKEGPLKVADKEFPDALVAFGDRLSDNKYPCHEMILLKKPGNKDPYRSYHCWAAAQLIRQFEFFDLQETLKKETERKEQYAASLSQDVLPDEPWESLKKRLEGKDPNIQWLSYCMWSGYQVRKQKVGYEPAGKIDCVLKDKKEKKIVDPPDEIFEKVIDFLLDTKDLNKNTLFSKLRENLLFVNTPPWQEDDNRRWSQLIVLVLEHAWRDLRQKSSNQRIEGLGETKTLADSQSADFQDEMNISEIMESAQNLLLLTRGVVIQILTSEGTRNGDDAEEGCISSELRELGRRFLRFYLAQEIAKPGSRLDQLYLGGERKDEHREAPPELKRTFIVNLSRFMLSVVSLIEKQFDIAIDPPTVTPTEELDSLLYIIDRFVHVELEVDERINIRQHLGRQVDSEVHHYLTRPHYRDHLLHVIDVFLLGHLLLNTNLYWIDSKTVSLVEHLTKLPVFKESDDSQPTLEEWMPNWAVASLLHDIGYQIGDGDSISSDPHIWKNYFALTSPVSESWLEFNWKGQKDQDSQSQQERFDFAKNLAGQLRKLSSLKDYLPEIDDNNIKNHGLLSALRIAQIIYHADYMTRTNNRPGKSEMAICYRHAIHAIAHHNLANYKVSFDSHPLACLLRLCDELQEWHRRKVNMEKVVKHLYLDLQEGHFTGFPSYEIFDSFKANLNFQPVLQNGISVSMEVSLNEKKPWFRFALVYRDSMAAYFDPTMTLLCKAYSLQHLDLSVPKQGTNDLKFSIDLYFPSPMEYGELTEYDIYALFTEEVRSLPLLRQFESIREAEPGLIRIGTENKKFSHTDCFCIFLTRASDSGQHHGWLPCNPAYFFDQYIEFKKYILASSRARIPQK